MRLFARNLPNTPRPAKFVTLFAHPQHGKSTLLQCLVAQDVLDSLTARKVGMYPAPQLLRPIPSEVFIRDQKREIEQAGYEVLKEHYPVTAKRWRDVFGNKVLGDLPNVHVFMYMGEACEAFLEADRVLAKNAILVAEECLTCEPSEFKVMNHCCVVRRRGRDSMGGRVYATTQRPYGVPVAWRDMIDEGYWGYMDGTRDIAYAAGMMNQEKAESLPTLKPGQWRAKHSDGIIDFTEKD